MPLTRRLACAALALLVACGSSHETTDASSGQHADAPPPSGDFGAECTKHGDCISGLCVEAIGGTGGVCTKTCNDDCPADWNCREVTIDGQSTKVCIPNAPQLCLACAADGECGSDAACLTIDGAGACATKCTTACPTGYKCAADTTGAHGGTFCQPVTGSCSCTPAMAGASRACTNKNAIGTCYGTQNCAPATGWSACTAATAGTETCDGIDNDCDFLIDENVGGGADCTITNAAGTCPGKQTCTGKNGFTCEGQTPMPELCNDADDNCNLQVDEGFAGLGTLCSPGVGACQRFGSMRCNAAGTGVECSVVAGTPGVEKCNYLDDNCNGTVDETFPALGSACSVGLGVCTRYGTTICSADGSTTACSVMAGTNMSSETCNYLDDDCDGVVDNGFRNAGTGAYDMTANCGACGNNCAAAFTGAAHANGVCSVASGSPQCAMVCDPGAANLNNSTVDGCEFVLDASVVYVSIADPQGADDATCGLGPSGTGAGNHPCHTITYGLGRANTLSRPNVQVADGTYDEAVTLISGINVLGGYRAVTWERHLATTSTVIQGVASVGNHDRTVIAANVSAAVFEGFVVRGSFNSKSSGNSYAIYVTGGTATLTIRNNQIFAGRGGPGTSGTAGTNGVGGVNGTGSVNGSYDGFIATGSGACAASNNRQLTNGGIRTCGTNNVSGGNGGGNRCPPASNFTQFSGINGFAGNPGAAPGGGAGGVISQGGFDGVIDISGQNQTCTVPSTQMYGTDGALGQPGAHGMAGPACTSPAGTVVANEWVNGSAMPGVAGANGGGGGGGAGGGGAHCGACSGQGKDRLGAHGGGGGSGGCGGGGGSGGNPGGGVFGIFISGGAAPALSNNTIARGDGGVAGDGGIGGSGGLGGAGGDGGGTVLLCAAKAGRGGDGGSAGHGSGGGGGCGGSSYGIFTSGLVAPSYCSSNTVSGGSGGAGGAGGYSGGNPGLNGTAGVLGDCTSI